MKRIFGGVKDFFGGIYSYFLTFVLLISSVFSFFEIIEKPEIKVGEFDFSLTYEIDSEIKIIEGTYVCEFDGIERSFNGASRQWKGYIRDHDDSTCYLLKTIDKGEVKLELDLNPDYFMSDPDFIDSYDIAPEPYIYITSGDPTVEDPTVGIYFEIYQDDDIKIISFEYDEPIENEYRYI